MWSRGDPVFKFGSFFVQAEDGIRDLVRSRGLGDVYKRQPVGRIDGAYGDRHLICSCPPPEDFEH